MITIGESMIGCPLCKGAQVDPKGHVCVGCGGYGYIAQIAQDREEPPS